MHRDSRQAVNEPLVTGRKLFAAKYALQAGRSNRWLLLIGGKRLADHINQKMFVKHVSRLLTLLP